MCVCASQSYENCSFFSVVEYTYASIFSFCSFFQLFFRSSCIWLSLVHNAHRVYVHRYEKVFFCIHAVGWKKRKETKTSRKRKSERKTIVFFYSRTERVLCGFFQHTVSIVIYLDLRLFGSGDVLSCFFLLFIAITAITCDDDDLVWL